MELTIRFAGFNSATCIADRGTAADVISMVVALMLLREGVIDKLHEPQRLHSYSSVSQQQSQVIYEIRGKGLIGTMYVVEGDLPWSL
jgi:hypothetical protein